MTSQSRVGFVISVPFIFLNFERMCDFTNFPGPIYDRKIDAQHLYTILRALRLAQALVSGTDGLKNN